MDILTDTLGMRVTYTKWDKENRLPFYLAAGYDFQKAEIDGCFCILIRPKEKLPTSPALKKQIQRIQKVELLPIVVRVKSMSSFRRKNMIANRIPFIIDGKQAYLPFMGTFLQAKAEAEVRVSEKFITSAQVLFLLYMYQESGELYLSEAVRALPYSAMTITRAAKQLEESGFFSARKEGVNKIIYSNYSKKELYEQARESLSSPVIKKGFLPKERLSKQMILAGTSALAERTILNDDILLVYAVDKKGIDQKELQNELLDPNEQVEIEVWKYSPQLFADNEGIDTISLVLSLMDDKDERVEEAVDEILDEFWRKEDGIRA